MEKIITGKVRKNLSEHTARIILERSDRMASSTLEQLRKSTDRACSWCSSPSRHSYSPARLCGSSLLL